MDSIVLNQESNFADFVQIPHTKTNVFQLFILALSPRSGCREARPMQDVAAASQMV
jgi:hypothetical protein